MIKTELSVAYKLIPVMSAGAFDTMPEDGRFRFSANHERLFLLQNQ